MPIVTKAPSQRSSVMAASQPLAGRDIQRGRHEEHEPGADIDEIQHGQSPYKRGGRLNLPAYKFECSREPGIYRFHIGRQISNQTEYDHSRRIDWASDCSAKPSRDHSLRPVIVQAALRYSP